MESVDLQMEDIFGDGEDVEDALFDNRASIPDLPVDDGFQGDGAEGGDQNIENDAVLARLRDLSKGAAKRTVKRVQPKLDPLRLTGERGIGVLPAVFKDVKFQGKGHEADDLKKIMRYLEHWTHRLFPKMPFDEVLDRIEKLGTKREVQTYIKRMRMDIPIQSEENAITEENHDPVSTSVGESERVTSIGDDEEDVLDEIFREDNERVRQSQSSQSASNLNNSTNQITASPSSQPNTSLAASTSSGLTAEQLERMEANKRRARERRMAKLGLSTLGTPSSSQPQTTIVNTPLAYPSSPAANLCLDPSQKDISTTPLEAENVEGSISNLDTTKANLDFDQLTEDQLLADLDCDSNMDSTEKGASVSTPSQSETTTDLPSGSTDLNSLENPSTSDLSNSLPSSQTVSSVQDQN